MNTKNEGKKEEKCRKSEWPHVFRISLVTFTIRLIVVGSLGNEKMHIEFKENFQATFTEFNAKLYSFKTMQIR